MIELDEKNLIITPLDLQFIQAAENGNFEKVKIFLTTKNENGLPIVNIHGITNYHYNALVMACKNNHLEIVQYLLTSQDISEHSNINDLHDFALEVACKAGHLDIVQYLLTSPELTIHSDLNPQENNAFTEAMENHQYHIIDFILKNPSVYDNLPELANYAFIHSVINSDQELLFHMLKNHISNTINSNEALHQSCRFGHNDLALEFMHSTTLPQQGISLANNFIIALNGACETDQLDLIRHLVEDTPLISQLQGIFPNEAMNLACHNWKLDSVQYLLEQFSTYSEQTPHTWIENVCLIPRAGHNNYAILETIIIGYNIEQTPEINSFLKKDHPSYYAPHIINLFKNRQFHDRLHSELSAKNINKKITKI